MSGSNTKMNIILKSILISLLSVVCLVSKSNSMPTYPKCYVYFVVNINDFHHVDLSAAYLNKILDLFSRYNLGIDLYFTEPVLKAFNRKHPELIERIKGYPLATINYHVRQPHPCDENMLRLADQGGRCRALESLNYEYLVKKISEFESHELVVEDYDFKSATYCPHYNQAVIGGFDYVKEVFKTTPIFSGANMEGVARKVLMAILKSKGLQGIVIHHRGRPPFEVNTPFRRVLGLLERPAEVSLVIPDIYRVPSPYGRPPDPYGIFLSQLASFSPYQRPVFGNVLVHDFDFYHRGVWYDDQRLAMRFGDWQKSAQEQALFWRTYEYLVKSLASNREIKVVNAKDIMVMSEQFSSKRP